MMNVNTLSVFIKSMRPVNGDVESHKLMKFLVCTCNPSCGRNWLHSPGVDLEVLSPTFVHPTNQSVTLYAGYWQAIRLQ